MYPIVTYPSDCEYYWDDIIYSSKLNAVYKISPGAVILRRAIKEHKIGVLSVGDEFAVDGISIQDCLAIVDEFLYINADRRLNLLTGEIEHVNNPKHQKIAAKQTVFDFLPAGAPAECRIVAKIDRNDGEYLLNVVEIFISYTNLIDWLSAGKKNYTVLYNDYDHSITSDEQSGIQKMWRLIVSRTHIVITIAIKHTTYNVFHDFIVESIQQNTINKCRIIVPCLKTGIIKWRTVENYECSTKININILNTYYFTTARTFYEIIRFYGLYPDFNENGKIDYDDDDSDDGDYSDDDGDNDDDDSDNDSDNDSDDDDSDDDDDDDDSDDDDNSDDGKHVSRPPAFDMLIYIKPKNIEPVQTPLAAYSAAIKCNNVVTVEYSPNKVKYIQNIIFSGEHLYSYTIDKYILTLTKLDDYIIYTCDIKKIYTDDELFYMRGDIIYTCRGYINIVTGEVTIAPNETIKPNQRANMLNSFDFSIPDDGSKYIAGQYLVTYTEFYKAPVEIEGFRALVNGNISIYEYAGVSKVRTPTRTKPAPRE